MDLPGDLPSSGRLGLMARIRGSGRATFTLRSLDTPAAPFGEAPAGAEFRETIVRGGNTPGEYSWSGDRLRPVALEVQTDSDAFIEVDCVVPFFAR
jgi:hypothetical protein